MSGGKVLMETQRKEGSSNRLPSTRSRLGSKSSNRAESRSKCTYLVDLLSKATWTQGVSPEAEDVLEEVISGINGHIASPCKCVPDTGLLFLLGNTFFELYLMKQRLFRELIEAEEQHVALEEETIKATMKERLADEGSPSSGSSQESAKPSKFDSLSFPQLLNLSTHCILMEPLTEALHVWNQAANASNAGDFDMNKLRVIHYMTAAFYVFQSLKVVENQHRCALLLLKLSKDSSDLLMAYCLSLTVYVELGATQLAKDCLKQAQRVEVEVKAQKPEVHEVFLFFLLKCEVELMTGKGKRSGFNLKEFIHSPYLQKLTLNRYYLKGLALLLATKHKPSDYSYSSNYQEFIEPVQMATCIMKRWHKSAFASSKDPASLSKDAKSEEAADPVWYRFAVYSFALNAYRVATEFYLNMGMPVDMIFLHNPLMIICRKNCLIYWLTRILVISAKIDKICDKKDSAVVKLNNALSILTHDKNATLKLNQANIGKFSFGSCFIPSISSNKSKMSSASYSIESWDDSVIIENCSPVYAKRETLEGSCGHVQNVAPYLLMKQVLKSVTASSCSSGDFDTDSVFFDNENNDIDTNFRSDMFTADLLKIEAAVELIVLQNSSKDAIEKLKNLNMVKIIQSVKSSSISLQKIMGEDKTEFSTDLMKQLTLPIKFHVTCELAYFYIKLKNCDAAVSTLQSVFRDEYKFYFEDYNNRLTCGKLALLYLKAKVLSPDIRSDLVQFDPRQVEDDWAVDNCSNDIRTPSPVRKRVARVAPKAPKGKHEYAMEEIKSYMESLAEAAYKDSTQSKTVSKALKPTQPKKRSTRMSTRSLQSSEASDNSGVTDILKLDAMLNAKKRSIVLKPRSKSIQEKPLEAKLSRVTRGRSQTVSSASERDLNSLDSLSNILQNIQIGDSESSQRTGQTANLFKQVVEASSVTQLKEALHSLIEYFGNQSPSSMYSNVHGLLFRLFLEKKAVAPLSAAFHFAESISATSLRYRTLLVGEKKKKKQKQMGLNMESIAFNPTFDAEVQFEDMMKQLPSNWRVVQIHCMHNNGVIPDLYVSRYEQGKSPIFLKIRGNSEKFTRDFMSEMKEIIKLSNGSIINKEAETFWAVRYALDKRLEILLQSVDGAWFGPFKGILLGKCLNKVFGDCCESMKAAILQLAAKLDLICTDERLLEVIIESFPVLSTCDFEAAIGLLFACYSTSFLKRCLKTCDDQFCQFYPIDDKASVYTGLGTGPVALILNKPIEGFPFECLPVLLKTRQKMFRVPSLRFLSAMLKAFKSGNNVYSKGAQDSNVFYILNPADNLSKTEDVFRDRFRKEQEWTGVIGKSPSAQQLSDSLEQKDVYIFFGHGAGTSYYRLMADNLEGVSVRSAALVIGCSSGKLISDGDQLESYGTSYRFLMNGSPCYVGVLWDVTDRDIDKFSDKLMEKWLPSWGQKSKGVSVDEAVLEARSVCKLKYLIGAAPVVYGLPVTVFSS